MDSTETILRVREDLAEIKKILAWMEKSREIHQIDIDILLNKTRYLYTQFMDLPVGRFEIVAEGEAPAFEEAAAFVPEATPEPQPPQPPQQSQQSQPPQPPSPPQPIKEPVTVPQPIEIPVPFREPMPVPVPEEIPVPIREPEPIPEPQPSQPSQKSQPTQPPQPTSEPVREREPVFFNLPYQAPFPKSERQPARETVSEINLFQRDSSLNEALGKQKPIHDVASSITDIPVADIWSAITINERFLFIRELFGNDAEGFKNTVSLLNSLGSWEAAKKFMSDRFEWDKNNQVATDFLNVVRRRFLK